MPNGHRMVNMSELIKTIVSCVNISKTQNQWTGFWLYFKCKVDRYNIDRMYNFFSVVPAPYKPHHASWCTQTNTITKCPAISFATYDSNLHLSCINKKCHTADSATMSLQISYQWAPFINSLWQCQTTTNHICHFRYACRSVILDLTAPSYKVKRCRPAHIWSRT